jgi:hypothetical protein
MDHTCENCTKKFSSKYTLKKHVELTVCKKDVKESTKEKNDKLCTSIRCNYKTHKNSDLQKHIKSCKFVEIDNIIKTVHIENDTMLSIRDERIKQLEYFLQEKDKEIERISKEHLKEIERMEKEQDRLTCLFEKVITKPAVMNNTTNNTTTTTIRGSNNNLQSFLASPELYEKQVDPERIKTINQSDVEHHFWSGQKGIARFCVDHIVNTTDEDGSSKMLLCCTDPSRKRFKYVDADNQVVDDIEARHFIDTVSAPIVTVCRKVYDSVVMKIEHDKKGTKDAFDLNLLENKTNIAQQKFLEINNIGDHNRNSDYKNEMSILLKK